jgi:hypothetical protein
MNARNTTCSAWSAASTPSLVSGEALAPGLAQEESYSRSQKSSLSPRGSRGGGSELGYVTPAVVHRSGAMVVAVHPSHQKKPEIIWWLPGVHFHRE